MKGRAHSGVDTVVVATPGTETGLTTISGTTLLRGAQGIAANPIGLRGSGVIPAGVDMDGADESSATSEEACVMPTCIKRLQNRRYVVVKSLTNGQAQIILKEGDCRQS